MAVEKDIEATLAGIIDGLVDVPVIYRRMTREEREPINLQPTTYIEVLADNSTSRSEASCIYRMSITVTVAAKKTDCPDADYCNQLAEPILEQFKDWDIDKDGACDDLTTTTFRVDGFFGEEGQSTTQDSTGEFWYTEIKATIIGCMI